MKEMWTGQPLTEAIASICHEANRAYCLTLNDKSQPPWSEAPQWQKDSAIHGVEAHLSALESGTELPPSHSHDSWLKEKTETGWVYGETKDPEAKTHPCCVPYDQLPYDQKIKDYIFGAIVKAVFDGIPKAQS